MSNSDKISYLRLFLFFLPRNKFTLIRPYIVDHSFIRLIRGKTCLHKCILYFFGLRFYLSLCIIYCTRTCKRASIIVCYAVSYKIYGQIYKEIPLLLLLLQFFIHRHHYHHLRKTPLPILLLFWMTHNLQHQYVASSLLTYQEANKYYDIKERKEVFCRKENEQQKKMPGGHEAVLSRLG